MKKNKITTVDSNVSASLLKYARQMRSHSTKAEKVLWKFLRNRKLNNWKFRRQHPVADFYILDFYCVQTRVAIELDGEVHLNSEQMKYDENRTLTLLEYKIRTIRFTNIQVLTDIEDVLRSIVEFSNGLT